MMEGKVMKKAILFGLVVGIIFMFGSLVMAKKEKGDLAQPVILTCSDMGDFICFDWDDVPGAFCLSFTIS